MSRFDFIFGCLLLGSLDMLALCFFFGKGEEKTSFGLMPLVVAIAGMAAAWGIKVFATKINGGNNDGIR